MIGRVWRRAVVNAPLLQATVATQIMPFRSYHQTAVRYLDGHHMTTHGLLSAGPTIHPAPAGLFAFLPFIARLTYYPRQGEALDQAAGGNDRQPIFGYFK